MNLNETINYNQIIENTINNYINSLNENEQDELFGHWGAGLSYALKNWDNKQGWKSNYNTGVKNYYNNKAAEYQQRANLQGGQQTQYNYPQQNDYGNQPLYYQDGSYRGRGNGGNNVSQYDDAIDEPHENDDTQGNVNNGDETTKRIQRKTTRGNGNTKTKRQNNAQNFVKIYGSDENVIGFIKKHKKSECNSYIKTLEKVMNKTDFYYTQSGKDRYFGEDKDTLIIMKQFGDFLKTHLNIFNKRLNIAFAPVQKPQPQQTVQTNENSKHHKNVLYENEKDELTRYGMNNQMNDTLSNHEFAATEANGLANDEWIKVLYNDISQLVNYSMFYGEDTVKIIKVTLQYLSLEEEIKQDEESDVLPQEQTNEKEKIKKKNSNWLKRILTTSIMIGTSFLAAYAPNFSSTSIPQQGQEETVKQQQQGSFAFNDARINDTIKQMIDSVGNNTGTINVHIKLAQDKNLTPNTQESIDYNANLSRNRIASMNAYAKSKGYNINFNWDGIYDMGNGNIAIVSFPNLMEENKKRNLNKIISEEINRYLRKNLI